MQAKLKYFIGLFLFLFNPLFIVVNEVLFIFDKMLDLFGTGEIVGGLGFFGWRFEFGLGVDVVGVVGGEGV